MWVPEGKTEDGFETTFGVNHLGWPLFLLHFKPIIVCYSGITNIKMPVTEGKTLSCETHDLKRCYQTAVT